MHPSIDTHTLNLNEIQKLPTSDLRGYHLGPHGMGCFLDAPGFPSYLVQPVYTSRGDTPSREGAPTVVLDVRDAFYVLQSNTRHTTNWDEEQTTYQALLHRLWKPLPMDHLRVQMWMANVYRHFRHCYQDVERPEYGRPGTLICPIPYYKKALAKTFRVKATASETEMAHLREAMEAEQARVTAKNAAEEARAVRIATPDNHQAVRLIRKFYPDYQPNLEWIAAPPASTGQEDWWETAATRPEPSECRHRNLLVPGSFSSTWAHPTKPGAHCPWCGRTNPTEEGK